MFIEYEPPEVVDKPPPISLLVVSISPFNLRVVNLTLEISYYLPFLKMIKVIFNFIPF
jgi:hypothetical protein